VTNNLAGWERQLRSLTETGFFIDAVRTMKGWIDATMLRDSDKKKTGFLALQIMADLHMVYRDRPWGDPTEAIYVYKGYGGDQGLSLFKCKEEYDVPEETANLKKQIKYKECKYDTYQGAVKEMFQFLNDGAACSENLLTMIGCQRIETNDHGKEVVDKYTGQPLDAFYVEHAIGCKIFMVVSRAKGGRSVNAPDPWRAHLHPAPEEGLFPDRFKEIAQDALACFEGLGENKIAVLGELPKIAWLKSEHDEYEKKEREQNSVACS
jgi:hypothetical protein